MSAAGMVGVSSARLDVLPAHTLPISTSARIAIVEDDDAIRTLFEDLLEGEGYLCVASTSWLTDVEQLELQRPDLLILDIVLGGGASGWKFLDELSRHPHAAAIPVIVCTADTGALVDKQAVLRERGIRWLAKPFDVQDLLHLIEDSLTVVRTTQ
jgi:CheY-like chemotaxis protein